MKGRQLGFSPNYLKGETKTWQGLRYLPLPFARHLAKRIQRPVFGPFSLGPPAGDGHVRDPHVALVAAAQLQHLRDTATERSRGDGLPRHGAEAFEKGEGTGDRGSMAVFFLWEGK